MKPDSSRPDASWRMVVVHIVGVLTVATLTTTAGLDPTSFLAFTVALAIGATVVTGTFYVFRRKKESRLLKRSFIIAIWVILALIALGERS